MQKLYKKCLQIVKLYYSKVALNGGCDAGVVQRMNEKCKAFGAQLCALNKRRFGINAKKSR